MKIICLVENTEGNSHCPYEHGLCYYIETKNHKILMDTGASDLLVKNAASLGVDLKSVDTVIISHGHYDHGGGLPAFLEMNPTARVYIHKDAFDSFYSIHEDGPRYIGLPEGLVDRDQITLTEGNTVIDSELSLLSEISSALPVPSANHKLKVKRDSGFIPDSFSHEQCLVITERGNRYLFSGCAHHGILNIMNSFKKHYGSDPAAVFSGFHMMKKSYTDEDINTIIDTALTLSKTVSVFYTGHCTGTTAYEAMKKIMGAQLNYMHCGDQLILNPAKKGNNYMKLHKAAAWGTVICFIITMITGYKRK